MSRAAAVEAPRRGWRRRNLQPLSVVWGAVVWVALWGDLSVANVLAGALLGLVVALVFPLPPLPGGVRIRPVALLRVLGAFVVDVVVASIDVIRVILRPGDLRNSVIAVKMRSDSDLVATIVGEMHSLVPGSIAVDVRRSDHTVYLHVLDTPDEASVQETRRRAATMESRVAAALGMDIPAEPQRRRDPAPEEGEDR